METKKSLKIKKGIWIKNPLNGKIVCLKTLKKYFMVDPETNYHFPISPKDRIKSIVDKNSFIEFDKNLSSKDPINFQWKGISYKQRLKEELIKRDTKSSVITGIAKIYGISFSLSVMDFSFFGGSMGSIEGEKITKCIERSLKYKIPVVIVCSSGGARMHEGIFSLMQMAKICSALLKLSSKKILYISILTNPTMAGVMASFGSLGDIILAEPNANIGFAGKRVIENITQVKKFPKEFQKSEYLIKKGLIDQIVERKNIRKKVGLFFKFFHCNK
jgi:acetyl-CoA carboxylase carboxyl transferase beta subunit